MYRVAAKAIPRTPGTDLPEPDTENPRMKLSGGFLYHRHQLLEFLFRFRLIRFLFRLEFVVEYPFEECAVFSQNPLDIPGQIVELLAIALHPLLFPLFLRCSHHAETWQHPPVPSD